MICLVVHKHMQAIKCGEGKQYTGDLGCDPRATREQKKFVWDESFTVSRSPGRTARERPGLPIARQSCTRLKRLSAQGP